MKTKKPDNNRNSDTAEPTQRRTNEVPDPLLRDPVVAQMLDIPASTLRVWRHRGIGPAYVRYSPKQPRYRLSDVLDFIEQNRVVPKAGGEK